MDLNKLFETQKKLDDRIVAEKCLQGQDLLDNKVLALQVELGELANEWRGFKFWSGSPEPRTKIQHLCPHCDEGRVQDDFSPYLTMECGVCEGDYFLGESNPMLIEYVDCLHFILSIGNEINIYKFEYVELIDLTNNIKAQFNSVFQLIGNWKEEYLYMNKDNYFTVVNEFLCLGKMLGFTWQEIERAYYDKNKINHKRQESGY